MSGGLSDPNAADHPCDLFDAFRGRHSTNARVRAAPRLALANDKVRGGKSGNLRKMRYADHLPMPSNVVDCVPDNLGDRSPDPGVDLVEDIGVDGSLVRKNPL
jgi:hypothetical protein